MYLERLENEEKEINAVTSTLKEVICECAEDELHHTRENTIDQLDDDVETFME